jgi:hypothetical protein
MTRGAGEPFGRAVSSEASITGSVIDRDQNLQGCHG